MDMQLWTFRFLGGDPFALTIPWNPRVEHEGVTTISHLLCTEQVADAITSFAEHHDVRVLRHTEGQSEEQAEERRALLGDKEAVFACAACPECFWFDPKLTKDLFCGLVGWPDDFKMAGLTTHDKAVQDFRACPVRS